jgi:MFS family permease
MGTDGSPRAVGVVFAVAGFVSGAAVARMPSIRTEVGATSAQLSFALVCIGIGSIMAMPLTARLTERLSSAVVVRLFSAIVLVGWMVVGLLHDVPALAACLLAVGAGYGVWDVAMNVQGHTVEQRRKRVLMPIWHALFSFGSVAGAGAGAIAANAGLGLRWQFPITGVLAAATLVVATTLFVPDRAAREVLPETAEFSVSAQRKPAPPPRRGLTRVEILLGLIVVGTTLGEGAANDWLGLMLVDTRGVHESFGGLALAGFNLTMGIGRLAGVPVISRLGRAGTLRASGSLACAGVLLLCLVDTPVTALVGAAAWGLGLAVVFPSGISAAGEVEGRGARAIASVSTIGYGGFLFGAPLIGQLTRVVPLDRALLVVAGMALLIVVLAPFARERTAPRAA